MGCIFPMVIVSMLHHAEFGRNDCSFRLNTQKSEFSGVLVYLLCRKYSKSGFSVFLVFLKNTRNPQKPRQNRIFWKLFPNEPLFETDALLLRGLFCSTFFVCQNGLILRFEIWIFRWFFKFLTFLFEDCDTELVVVVEEKEAINFWNRNDRRPKTNPKTLKPACNN